MRSISARLRGMYCNDVLSEPELPTSEPIDRIVRRRGRPGEPRIERMAAAISFLVTPSRNRQSIKLRLGSRQICSGEFRSEERRGGTECDGTWKSRGSPRH